VFSSLDHPNVTLAEWRKFQREFPPSLIKEVLDRSETLLPPWFMPLARGAAIPSDELLRQAGHYEGKPRPRGWNERGPNYFDRIFGEPAPSGWRSFLVVRESDLSGLWTIERLWATRQGPSSEVDEVLVHTFGWTPIFTRSYQAAMQLAMHCHTNGPPAGLLWVKGMPDDPTPAIEFATHRQNAEEADTIGRLP